LVFRQKQQHKELGASLGHLERHKDHALTSCQDRSVIRCLEDHIERMTDNINCIQQSIEGYKANIKQIEESEVCVGFLFLSLLFLKMF
jgi:hypothetical protein